MRHDMRMTPTKISRYLNLIEPLAHRRRHALPPLRMKRLDDPLQVPDLTEDASGAQWQTLTTDTYWGNAEQDFIMRTAFSVPDDFDPHSPIALHLPLGDAGDFSHPEALAYIDGAAYATTDRHHQEFVLPENLRDGKAHTLVLHGWTGLMGGMSVDRGKQLRMRECAVVQIDVPTRELIAAARVALQAADLLQSGEPAKTRLYNALDAAFQALDLREPLADAFYASVPAALETLRAGIAAAGAPLDVDLIAAGHAHIDVAWLWTLGQTRRKAGRTFHTVLRQMEQYPNYHFTQSQPQLYDYVRQDYPELFEAIRERVADGRWEPIGGMWIEADCNISGPESLARQFLLGRAFFREHFGKDAESPVLWLPDVFGYAWNLPQLIKLAGLEYFFTIKIGWNQVNKLPYDSFWWQGLDGTRVLTHFSTAPEMPWNGGEPNLMNTATYNANLSAFTALGSWLKLKHKEAQNVLLMSYGYGDGGGGPTREMNENALELEQFPALPKVRQGKVIDFFRRLEQESGHLLPEWNAELYLEIHRGTYTTQSRNKRANRKSEFLLHDTEFLVVMAALADAGWQVPQAEIRKAWELVCLNQFHDIIPGSSINAVYRESLQQYEQIRQHAENVREAALNVLREHNGGDVLLINPTSFERDDVALLAGDMPAGMTLKRGTHVLACQPIEGGVLVEAGEMEPYSIVPLQWSDAAGVVPSTALICDDYLLENDWLRVELNQDGDICRIYDKLCEREVLPAGLVANQWQAFEDRPLHWDAWDVDIFYDDKHHLAAPADSIRLIERGPLRATIEIRRRILNSSYTQRISLLHNRRQIDIDTTIDWRERHILLKTAFPVDVLSPVATHEVQWGFVQRPTHRNTSWDWARFETCAQKWVDLSEGDYGAALLNDCKYGHDIQGNVMRISLLRAPTLPDPEADQGEHHFQYSLLLHGEPNRTGVNYHAIAAQAYLLNDPLLATSGSGGAIQPQPALLCVSGSAIIETIKPAEDGDGVIVRLYECNRQRGWVTLHSGFALHSAQITNLIEEDQDALEVDEHRVRLYLKPFQIVNLRLRF